MHLAIRLACADLATYGERAEALLRENVLEFRPRADTIGDDVEAFGAMVAART